MKKILFAGESWTSVTTHIKGFDSFVTSVYEEGGTFLIDALEKGGHEVRYIRNHEAPAQFPKASEDLSVYDMVILSDIGSNTLLIPPEVFTKGSRINDRCELIKNYVLNGGALLMVGGYMSFTGIDAKTRYGMTALKDVLPVDLLPTDDRMEAPQGFHPTLANPGHPVFKGIQGEWPYFLGYNQTVQNNTKGETVAYINNDPFISLGRFGKGRSAAFTSDCSPHWAPMNVVNWEYYNTLWNNLVDWLTEK